MTRETKVGLLMVVLLVGVFGFMVYRKLHEPSKALAGQNDREESTNGEPNKSVFGEGGEPSDGLGGPGKQVILTGTAAPRSIGNDVFATPVSASGREPFDVEPARQPQAKPKLPTPARDEDAFFDSASNPFEHIDEKTPTRPAIETDQGRAPAVTPSTTNEDPFESPLDLAQSTSSTSDSAPPVDVASSQADDPFASSPASATKTEPPSVLEAPSNKTASNPKDAFHEIEESKKSPTAMKAPTFEAASTDNFAASESTPRGQHAAGDDRFGGFVPVDVNRRSTNEFAQKKRPEMPPIRTSDPTVSTRHPAPTAPIDEDFAPRSPAKTLIPGETYNIEPNDNFWTISRKKYGTGRYFMALSQHNLQVIPDPKRMKPGVTINTPSADLLERTYPTLISKAAPASPAQSVESSSPSNTARGGESGFFVSPDGVPMYRVGKEDTLSDIAQSHLGRSSRWVQVYEMNRDILADGNKLTVGTMLRLPGDASRVDVVGTPRAHR